MNNFKLPAGKANPLHAGRNGLPTGKKTLHKSLTIQSLRIMHPSVTDFNANRSAMNRKLLDQKNKVLNRLFNLDTNAYLEGALPVKTKEMLGLVASMVLRCDDCVKYHLGTCSELGITTEEIYEVFAIANIVGGTIVIPHTRRAAEYWDALQTK